MGTGLDGAGPRGWGAVGLRQQGQEAQGIENARSRQAAPASCQSHVRTVQRDEQHQLFQDAS